MATVLATLLLPAKVPAVPARLVIALDGIAYRDMQALQAGITRTNFFGHTYQLRAFTSYEGYYPASRMISTFPSASDVAWTDIFGDRPLPGYQRTYYSKAANSMIAINGVTTTMEHERQMDWQLQNGFLRAMGYLFAAQTFREEMDGTVKNFWKCPGQKQNCYIYLRASDDSQHLDRDIFALLCEFDQKIQKMRARYKAQYGRDLELVILSDHGHNHAGRGIRVQDAAFLEKAGYHVTKTISGPKDVVLPVVGIENWVEVHCAPAETETLARKLCQLEGVDLITAALPGKTNSFIVLNPQGELAQIEWHPAQNAFRYSCQQGDPLHYLPVVQALRYSGSFDADGYATAAAWMAATMTNHYPLALERIVRGHVRGALNPANILISLDNRFVNADWFTEKGSHLVTCRSTHGALDDICSDGIVLCNFKPTHDTSTARVAEQFDDFPGVRDFRAEESGAEWVSKSEQSLMRIPHVPFDRQFDQLPGNAVFLRTWSPLFAQTSGPGPFTLTIQKVRHFATSPAPQQFTWDAPLSFPGEPANERIFALPASLKLVPHAQYKISGTLQEHGGSKRLFEFTFYANADGQPAPY